jgi:hypothetical protein
MNFVEDNLRKIWQAGHGDRTVVLWAMTKQVTTLGAFSVSLAVKDKTAGKT